MTVRLEELLAAATPGPWQVGKKMSTENANYLPIVDPDRRLVVMPPARDAALIALAPDAVRLLIDMGDALRKTQRFCGGCIDADALLARLDRLGNTT